MKKLKSLLFVALITVLLSSCDDNKNDKKEYIQPDYLVGTWIIKQTGRLNSQAGIDYTEFDNGACQDDSYVFKTDLTFVKHNYTGSDCTDEAKSGTYNRENHLLALTRVVSSAPTPTSETVFCNISKLTKNELEFNYNDSDGKLTFLVLSKEE